MPGRLKKQSGYDAEKELETVINIGKRVKSKRRGGRAREAGPQAPTARKGDEKAADKAVKEPRGMQFAEEEYGEDSRQSVSA